ncbi:GNAT family N-acetyltransferase [Mycolicibacterium llatzerense]|uniref:Acetyltransferase n=1 Tax=Mycolicibacterium llatzerense TaxID=280871 RepID=A0A0D1LFE4_9MYCO|nr:GNAT family N-acetyltransferase [Mycolicibacterium llatzerense]KIU14711.1 acetyltransferase [Mycolicibacterium llatzerense]MCT7368379.1 acetyltransferase [Mycolicibacterium llatzerense]
MSVTDNTGAPTTVTAEAGRFTIAVDGRTVGLIDYLDQGGRRIFPHTEVQPEYGGRGLATILVAEALDATRAAGLRIVPECSMVSGYIAKHPEYAPLVDPA